MWLNKGVSNWAHYKSSGRVLATSAPDGSGLLAYGYVTLISAFIVIGPSPLSLNSLQAQGLLTCDLRSTSKIPECSHLKIGKMILLNKVKLTEFSYESMNIN